VKLCGSEYVPLVGFCERGDETLGLFKIVGVTAVCSFSAISDHCVPRTINCF
jgi:hypothetical protein